MQAVGERSHLQKERPRSTCLFLLYFSESQRRTLVVSSRRPEITIFQVNFSQEHLLREGLPEELRNLASDP